MNLDRDRWHVRWFHFVQHAMFGDEYRYREGTNLCHFMRVTMFWGPFWAVLVLCTVGWISTLCTYLLIVWPFRLASWWGLLVVPALVALSVLVARYGRAPVGSMRHCVSEHAKAVKGRFCPLVKFEGPAS